MGRKSPNLDALRFASYSRIMLAMLTLQKNSLNIEPDRNLPPGWANVRFGDAITLKRGFDLPKSKRQSGTVPIYAANGLTGTHNVHKVQGPGVVTGRSGTIGKVHFVDEDFWPLNTSLFVEDFHGNDPKFSMYLLRNSDLQKFSSSTAVPSLNRNVVHESFTCIPPLNEQHRIVTKIETLTTHSRKAREALDAINQHEKDLVLYYTNEWKESELGEHIEEYKKLVGNDWETYHSVGVSNSGFITKRKEPIAPKSAPRCKVVQPGDIVFNPIRFSIGSVARHYGREAVIVSPEYQVFRTKDTISSELVLRYLKSAQGRSRLEIATQGSVRYRVYLKNLKSMKMPIAPPIQQQKAEEFFSAINRIKEISITVTSELDRLDQSILAKAFRGELVPQDPTDEPATLVLQRIQAERENLKAKGKRKTKNKK